MRVKLAVPNSAANLEDINRNSLICCVSTDPLGTSLGTCHTSVVSVAPTVPMDTSVSETSALRTQ
uniref:Uncharacterized protein n=1 Tax=Mesocestoides corti TaxID=53468 RepID=A0A5K3EGS6_MESCO